MRRCRGCGSLYAAGDVGLAALQGLYDRYYERAPLETSVVVADSLDRAVRSAERFRKTGRWLDWGFGEGALLGAAERAGWSCFGVEVSRASLELGRSHGWAVSQEPEAEQSFPPGSFDVVSMVELLEHVLNPTNFLNKALLWLRPGGLLFITTPNARSVNRWLLGARWSIFSPPEHLTIWTARALKDALRRRGFRILAVRTHGLNPAEILAHLRTPIGAPPSVNRNQSAFALNEAFHRTPARRVAKRAANAVLSLLGIGDTLKVWAERQ